MLGAKLNVVAGALLFSTGGVAIKLSAASGWELSCLRSFLGAAALALVMSRQRLAWSWRSWIVAVPYAATFTLYALANKLTTAANAIFLQDTAPLYILLLAPLLLRERVRRADLAFMAALAVGVVLIFEAGVEHSATASDPALGNILAACSGLSWAFTVLGLRWLAMRSSRSPENPLTAIVAGCLLAGLVGALFALPLETVGPADWMIVAYLGVFQIALAYLLVTNAIRHVSALEASLLLLVEPVATPLWAWLFLGETPGALALVGGTIVIFATIAYAARRETAPAASPHASG